MAAEQSMTQTIMHAAPETTKPPMTAVREADNLVNNSRPIHVTPRLGGSVLKQQIFYRRVAH